MRRNARAGFLLTETLATFTISAFVLLGLVSASSVLLRAVDRSVAHVQDVDDLSRTLAAVTRDLSGLSRARFDGVEPQPFVFRGGPNSLFFARRERSIDGLTETHVVALREIVSGDGRRMVRADAPLPPRATSFAALRFGPQRDLATGALRLRFSYVARGKDGKTETRQRNWASGLRLPEAILVEAVDAESGRVAVATRVPIHADADIGCLMGQIAPNAASTASAPPIVLPPGAPPLEPPKTAAADFCALRPDGDLKPPVPR